eukprot:1996254-Prymnesium_polylepis.1
MLAKQEMNFMVALESDDAPTWFVPSERATPEPVFEHVSRSDESVVGSDDEACVPVPKPVPGVGSGLMRDGGSMAPREVPIGELLAAAGHRAGAR